MFVSSGPEQGAHQFAAEPVLGDLSVQKRIRSHDHPLDGRVARPDLTGEASPRRAGCLAREARGRAAPTERGALPLPRRASPRCGRFTETLLMRMNRRASSGAVGRGSCDPGGRHEPQGRGADRRCPGAPGCGRGTRSRCRTPRGGTVVRSEVSDSGSASITVRSGSLAAPWGRRAAERTMARTGTPRASNCVSTRPPVRPVPPTSRTLPPVLEPTVPTVPTPPSRASSHS